MKVCFDNVKVVPLPCVVGSAVEPVDIEKLIGELEIAVDRLRSLYEQYFMGIEKLEPMVPRKDVDRRITCSARNRSATPRCGSDSR